MIPFGHPPPSLYPLCQRRGVVADGLQPCRKRWDILFPELSLPSLLLLRSSVLQIQRGATNNNQPASANYQGDSLRQRADSGETRSKQAKCPCSTDQTTVWCVSCVPFSLFLFSISFRFDSAGFDSCRIHRGNSPLLEMSLVLLLLIASCVSLFLFLEENERERATVSACRFPSFRDFLLLLSCFWHARKYLLFGRVQQVNERRKISAHRCAFFVSHETPLRNSKYRKLNIARHQQDVRVP